jgi:tRNA wybutosine-synthesizing protein 2
MGYKIIGDIILVKEKDPVKAKNLLSRFPRCKSVVFYSGIHGAFRLPRVELLFGDSTETIHKENGCRFKLDLAKVMFCLGNLSERMRMSRLGKGEVIVDMFAGIGYFSIPMAKHSSPKKIIAIEANEVAFSYLLENIRLNKVYCIKPVLGDCAEKTPEGVADRVVMGYLDSYRYLEQGVKALKPGGILHYHEAVPEAILQRPVQRIKKCAEAEILGVRKVKKYAPGVWHVVVDARIAK